MSGRACLRLRVWLATSVLLLALVPAQAGPPAGADVASWPERSPSAQTIASAASRVDPTASREASNIPFAGKHSGNYPFTLEVSSDRSRVVKIVFVGSGWSGCLHTYTVPLSPGLAITNGRFSATYIAVPNTSDTLDIDGAFFDADGDGSPEQVIGGLSYLATVGAGTQRCRFRYWATASALDSDADGWSDTAERRLGSYPFSPASTPEHRAVPTTSLYGPGHCTDFLDNDGDGHIDLNDSGCAHQYAVFLPLACR